tara:strand:- start:221008 stop:221139 length:132 start_codon:yes stop_codon:yes gene_type:complete
MPVDKKSTQEQKFVQNAAYANHIILAQPDMEKAVLLPHYSRSF